VTVFQRIRLLPLLIIVSLLSLGVRFTELVAGVGSAGIAYAQHEVQDEAPPMDDAHGGSAPDAEAGEHAADLPPPLHEETDASSSLSTHGDDGSSDVGEKIEWRDAGDAALEYSEVKAGLYKELVTRRKELEKREKEMSTREALLKAGERELDQKLRELSAIRNEIRGLLKDQSAEEQGRIGSLVKIYEGMKAKDAARIFNTLDMDVLIQVISRMSERKSGAVLAEMSPERARTVTILLAQQQQLPGQISR